MMRVSFKSFLQHATKRSEQLEGRINFTAATGGHKLHFDICKGSAAPRREVAGCEGRKYICMRGACNKRTQCQAQASCSMVHTGCSSLKLKINMPELVFLTSDREKRQYKATQNLYYIPAEQKVTELKRQSNKIEISRASK